MTWLTLVCYLTWPDLSCAIRRRQIDNRRSDYVPDRHGGQAYSGEVREGSQGEEPGDLVPQLGARHQPRRSVSATFSSPDEGVVPHLRSPLYSSELRSPPLPPTHLISPVARFSIILNLEIFLFQICDYTEWVFNFPNPMRKGDKATTYLYASSVPKLQSCLGVRVENLSSKKDSKSGKFAAKCEFWIWLIGENHVDFDVREVTVILWWSLTLNHNMEVGNSLIK